MDKQQAEAVAQAVLEPHLQRQAVAHRNRASKAQARTERVAGMRRLGLWLIPVGGVTGSLVSYFAGQGLFDGIWHGALAGLLLTQAVLWQQREASVR